MQPGIGSVLWFVAVIAAIPLALWLLKRTPLGGGALGGTRAGTPRAVSVLALSAQQKLVTVEVGSGDARRWLVLGVTPQGIRTLHTMDAGADAPAAGAAPPAAAFSLLLARMRGNTGGGPDAR